MRLGLFWFTASFIAILFYFGSTVGRALKLPESNHYIQFKATGFPFLKIVGNAKNSCMGVVNDGQGKIGCRLDALKTGIGLRDEHMLEYLDAANHPMATLTFKADGDKFDGVFEVKGNKAAVSGKYSAQPLKFEFSINLNDYKIDAPYWKGVGVNPHVDIVAGLE